MSTVVNATTGRTTGSSASRRLRNAGQLPGVLYGLGKDPVAVEVVYDELRDALRTDAGLNTVFVLSVEGDEQDVVVRDVQRDPLKRRAIHADFLRVSNDHRVNVTIPVTLLGSAVMVAEAGGMVEQKMFSLKISCAPNHIPNALEIDISEMTIEGRLALGDVELPDGVTTKVLDKITVAASVVPRGLKSEDEEDEEGEEGEEGAEGEEGEASADGEASSEE